MENMSWILLVGLASFIGTLCTIAGFLLGRKKEALEKGQKEGSVSADLKYIKDTMTDLKVSVEKLDIKIDNNQEKINTDYKNLLVEVTKLKESDKELHMRVDKLEQLNR